MQGRRTGIAVLAAGAVIALGAAGCGGGGGGGQLSKSDYEKQLQAIGTDAKKSLGNLNFGNGKNLKDVATKANAAKDKINTIADQIGALNPPSDAKDDNTKMSTGLHALADQLGKLAAAADKGDAAALGKIANEFSASTAVKDADAAAKDLKKKGYNVGTLGQ